MEANEIISIAGKILTLLDNNEKRDAYIESIKGQMRHSSGADITDNPELYGFILSKIPEEHRRNEKLINSIYTVLSFYAKCGSQNKGMSLGAAVKAAEDSEGGSTGPRNKMTKVETARTFKNMSNNLRSLCIYLSNKGCTPDLSILIKDIYYWDFNQDKKRDTIIKWEQDYVKTTETEE